MYSFLEAQSASRSHGCFGKPAVCYHAFSGDVVVATGVADRGKSHEQAEDCDHVGRFTLDDDFRCGVAYGGR